MKDHGKRRKLTWIDYLRGWHWVGDTKVRNECKCPISRQEKNDPN